MLSNDDHHHYFQASWSELYLCWLEYSEKKDAIFCFPCYLLVDKLLIVMVNAFIKKEFNNLKKVNSEKNCPLLNFIGNKPDSPILCGFVVKTTIY
jgi:hypothetical protein